jgi:hypothetical protein
LTDLADAAKLTFHSPSKVKRSFMPDTPKQKLPTKTEAAKARSAAALRENLKRRKAQARQQSEPTADAGQKQSQNGDQTQ